MGFFFNCLVLRISSSIFPSMIQAGETTSHPRWRRDRALQISSTRWISGYWRGDSWCHQAERYSSGRREGPATYKKLWFTSNWKQEVHLRLLPQSKFGIVKSQTDCFTKIRPNISRQIWCRLLSVKTTWWGTRMLSIWGPPSEIVPSVMLEWKSK